MENVIIEQEIHSEVPPLLVAVDDLEIDENVVGDSTTCKTNDGGPALENSSASQDLRSVFQSMRELKEDPELLNFGLSASVDKILETYSCALISKSTLVGLVHGKMIITQNFVAFQGWPDTRVLLPLGRISRIEKMNTLYYIPNAILLCDGADKNEYFFSSFTNRDPCFSLLTRMCEVSKRLVEMHGRDIAIDNRTLIFGLQKPARQEYLDTHKIMLK